VRKVTQRSSKCKLLIRRVVGGRGYDGDQGMFFLLHKFCLSLRESHMALARGGPVHINCTSRDRLGHSRPENRRAPASIRGSDKLTLVLVRSNDIPSSCAPLTRNLHLQTNKPDISLARPFTSSAPLRSLPHAAARPAQLSTEHANMFLLPPAQQIGRSEGAVAASAYWMPVRRRGCTAANRQHLFHAHSAF
jgi:hypothetical protein